MSHSAILSIVFLLTGYGAGPDLAHAQMLASEPPLFRFFQQHFDSTLVYQTSSNWYNAPCMLLLAKQGQDVYFFTYRSPYVSTRGRFIPGGLTQQFAKQEAHFQTTIPDTNQYLLPQPMLSVTLLNTWKILHMKQLWKIRNTDPRPAREQCIVEDAATVTLHFLTRSGIRAASFYAPDAYEQCEGHGFNRRQVIRARNTLHDLLKQ